MEATNYMLMHLVEKCFPIVKDGNVMKLVDQKKKMTSILMHWGKKNENINAKLRLHSSVTHVHLGN
jgi:hypothetical protein